MNLQIPEQRSPKRCSQNQTGSRQTCRLRHDESNHLNRTHSHGHQHAELTRALDDRHEHGVDDAHGRQQEKDEKENKGNATIELHVVGQLGRQLLPRHHANRKGFAQVHLKCRRRRRRRGDVMELDPDFMDPSRRQAQQVLQRSERHEHQTLVHVVKPRVKHPGYRVKIISHRAIGRRRQQDDFRPHVGANRGGEFISQHDTFGHLSGQIAPFHHPRLQHSNLLFLTRGRRRGVAPQPIDGSR